MTLKLEVNQKFVSDKDTEKLAKSGILITPPLNEDYWLFRVKLDEEQAVVGFPKFTTIGIGFSKEEDWNTNLPFQCDAEQILNHIRHNLGPRKIKDSILLEAIGMIQKEAQSFIDGQG